ncbi:MAG TPA: mycofactocin-coupled SDR family oxidoreductase [Mycobacterium sp.]
MRHPSAGPLTDMVVLITGAGVGQGRSHAVTLAQRGAHIIALDVCTQVSDSLRYPLATSSDLDQTCRLVEQLGRRCLALKADVRDYTTMVAALDGALDHFDRLDGVCANAGVITFHSGGSLSITPEVFDLVVDTNLKGVFNTVCATVPHLTAAGGGSIVITSSAAGIRGHVGYAHYVASKHGVVGLMKAFANELAPYGIRVNTVHPTAVRDTSMSTDPTVTDLLGAQPLFRMGVSNVLPDMAIDPSSRPTAPVGSIPVADVSNAVAFLLSAESRFITGVQLPVDAGNANRP